MLPISFTDIGLLWDVCWYELVPYLVIGPAVIILSREKPVVEGNGYKLFSIGFEIHVCRVVHLLTASFEQPSRIWFLWIWPIRNPEWKHLVIILSAFNSSDFFLSAKCPPGMGWYKLYLPAPVLCYLAHFIWSGHPSGKWKNIFLLFLLLQVMCC